MARRRYLSTKISNDRAVNDLIAQYGDFAGVLYTWMIPHAEDDATINGDPFYILTEVIPGRRDKTEADVTSAIAGMVAVGLLSWLDDGRLAFPTGPFYGYQSYVKQESRRRESAEETSDSGEQRKTPENIVARALPPVTVPPSVSPPPPPRENDAPVRAVPKPKSKPRAPNPNFEAICLGCYSKPYTDITDDERGQANKAELSLRDVPDVTPEEIIRRAKHYCVMWPNLEPPSPTALSSNWTKIGNHMGKQQNGNTNATYRGNAERDNTILAELGSLGSVRPIPSGRPRAAG